MPQPCLSSGVVQQPITPHVTCRRPTRVQASEVFNILPLLSINVSSSDGAQGNLCNNTYRTCSTFGNYTHGWLLSARLNLFPVTFLSPDRVRLWNKVPGRVNCFRQRCAEDGGYVWLVNTATHLDSLLPSSQLTFGFSCVSSTAFLFSTWGVRRGE